LTGHLVFSTLHTNDAASGATRLIDIGVEPYLAASSVQAFIAQRLVRLICENCKEDKGIDDLREDMRAMCVKFQMKKMSHGRGCKKCGQTGYLGRTGIYEILVVNDDIRQLISKKVSSDVIKARAVELGMRVLKEDGWEKIAAGLTTPEEVLRVTQ
jgi:type II secretory ATPase GspE/PulE/Tfp pilus assembly ATPase PilB-like protein